MSNVQVQGIEEVQRNLAKLADAYGKAVADALVASGNDVRNTAIRSIQQKSSGRTVTRSRAGGSTYQHVAAAAGNAPNTDTGRLVGSVQVDVTSDSVFVGSTLRYAGMLEFGTRNMLPRPWLNPALEANRRAILKRVQDAVNRTTQQRGDV